MGDEVDDRGVWSGLGVLKRRSVDCGLGREWVVFGELGSSLVVVEVAA